MFCQQIVLGLGLPEQRVGARNLQGRHCLAIAVHALQHQKPHGAQTLLHDVHEFQQHQTVKAAKRAFHLLLGARDQLP